jgi:hypothetical protein
MEGNVLHGVKPTLVSGAESNTCELGVEQLGHSDEQDQVRDRAHDGDNVESTCCGSTPTA